jgi:hypothetical protein
MKNHLVTLAALAAATILGGAVRSASAAAFEITLDATGAAPITILDNGAGDTNSATGQITWSGSIGNFSTVITAGTSNSPGANGEAILQTHTISVRETSVERDTLTVSITDIGFNNPSGQGLTLGSSFAGTFLSAVPGENVSFQSYADSSNTPFGHATTAGLHTATLVNGSPAPVAFTTADRSAAFSSTGPYSMTDVTVINLSQDGQANVAGTTDVTETGAPGGQGGETVPLPAAVWSGITTLGLLGISATLRKRSRA